MPTSDRNRSRTLPPGYLRESLFALGVEFPCGGEARCGSCKIRVLAGEIPVTPEMCEALSAEEIAAGWRLGCFAHADAPVTVEIDQWSVPVLTDESRLPHEPRPGWGAAVDLGTTTLVVQRVSLLTGEVEAVLTALNPQAQHGADVMSRIRMDMEYAGVLRSMIRETLGELIHRVARDHPLEEVILCGNTVMHHLFCGLDLSSLAAAPFRTSTPESRLLKPEELRWPTTVRQGVLFLPCIGGFVGSDMLAGLIATGLCQSQEPAALADLGTNGEIAVTAGGRIFCASTAAGPAFEAGRIQAGMRAGMGAIDRIHLAGNRLWCHVIGGGEARGICGSGLVDAAACALEMGILQTNGRLPEPLRLAGDVSIFQPDIRELQLAKGAVTAGLRMLIAAAGTTPLRLHLAGAFGNYITAASAQRIGLLPQGVPIEAAGNSALRGTRQLLLAPSRREEMLSQALRRTQHVELAADQNFQDIFAESMRLSPSS